MDKYFGTASAKVGFQRFFRKIFLNMCASVWVPSTKRYILARWGGVRIEGPCFIGAHVIFDTIRPELISIGRGCTITSGCCILSHFINGKSMSYGEVRIGNNVFLGVHSAIVQPVTIGDNAILGAGSIVIRDIPENEVWAGNPAHFIKKLDNVLQ